MTYNLPYKEQCPHILGYDEGIDWCKEIDRACLLESNIECSEWESIKAERKEEPNGN